MQTSPIRALLIAAALALAAVSFGCGATGMHSAPETAPLAISVSVSPATVSLQTGATQQFSATITGTSNTAVTWSATGGTISSNGLYTAPSTAGTYTVKATSVADSTTSASASVTVTAPPLPPPVIAVSVSPGSVSLQAGGKQQFTATVTGTTNTAVTWSAAGGTVTTSGLYTAPAAAGTYIVTATSVADNAKSASATVSVTAAPPPITVSISPTSASLQTGATQQFTATVTGTTNTAVTWTATGGTVSASGLYTAPAAAGTYSVTATSVADNAKSASAAVSVTAAPPPITVSINPISASLQTSGTQQFTATVTGTTNTAVTWTATGGTISSSGFYTAPGVAGTYTVKAASVADSTKLASATVTVTAAPPPITVNINPTSASLQTGATQQFTATVTGTTNTAVTWSATGGAVTTSGLYTAPGTAGTYTVTATSAADNTKSASASVTVTVPPPMIALSPTSLTFSSIPATTTSSLAIVVSNTGGSNLTVTQVNVSGAAFSEIAPALPFTVAAGRNTAVTIQFAPQSAGTYTGSATFISNASNTPPVVTLSGTATPPPTFLLSVSPAALSFGTVLIGNNSTQAVTLTNTGNSSVTVSAANMTGTGFSVSGLSLPFTLAAGATKSVTLQFAPQVAGLVTGTASFVSNATNSPAVVSLSGTGQTPIQHSVDLSWSASTATVAGYNVYRGLQSGGPYTKVNSTLVVGTAYTDSTVQSGLTYYYVVTAVDSSGAESTYSNEAVAPIPIP